MLSARGWGFWDGVHGGSNLAWFWSASPESDSSFTGFQAAVKRDGDIQFQQWLSIDMREWHIYRIELSSSGTSFFVDGVEVGSTPARPRILHKLDIWIDNYRVYLVGGELQLEYLDVGQDQLMYIDWVKMFID